MKQRNKLFSVIAVLVVLILMLVVSMNSDSVPCNSKSDDGNSIYPTTIYDVIEVDETQYYDVGFFYEGLAYVQKDRWGLYGYIDEEGNVVIDFQFDYANDFSEGLAVVRIENSYGYIDKEGNIVIEPILDFAGSFRNGKAHVQINYHEYYIDKDGNIIE